MTAILSSSFAGSVGHDDMYIFIIVRIEVLVPVKAKVPTTYSAKLGKRASEDLEGFPRPYLETYYYPP